VAVATPVQLSTIAINEPIPNATVGTSFTAAGSYSLPSKLGPGWVKWQVQPAGDPPSPSGWQSTTPPATAPAAADEGWREDDPGVVSQAWSTAASSAVGSKTFYAGVFTPRSPDPVAVGSVDVTVS
jgi:hypothetical protein